MYLFNPTTWLSESWAKDKVVYTNNTVYYDLLSNPLMKTSPVSDAKAT